MIYTFEDFELDTLGLRRGGHGRALLDAAADLLASGVGHREPA